LARLFSLHRRDRFEVHAYSYGPDDGSQYRRRIQRDCDRFIDLNAIGDSEAASLIRRNRIDILVDLVGYMQGNRMGICARRPAPIQVRYLGMAGTSGADFYDYLIADEVVVPEAHAQFYSEQLVYLPHCYQINDDQQKIDHAAYSRTDFDLPIDGMVYCSFASHYKLDAIMFAIWMRILDQTEGSVLWLTPGSPTAERNLRNQACTHGIDPDRLVFTHRVAKEHHLGRLALADLALDTRVVGGAATTSDALWAGIPIVTLQGNHFASRMSASLLKAIGLEELITTTLDEYEALAVRLGNDRLQLDNMRRRLAHNRTSTHLFNTATEVGALEKGLEAMWARFERGQETEMIRL
jgi:protein O-GlcNAc transferase